jgi:hypothetical protein
MSTPEKDPFLQTLSPAGAFWRGRFSDGYVKTLMLQIFRGWKAETLAEVIWRQTKEIAYFEEQVAFFSKEDPEKAKAARWVEGPTFVKNHDTALSLSA